MAGCRELLIWADGTITRVEDGVGAHWHVIDDENFFKLAGVASTATAHEADQGACGLRVYVQRSKEEYDGGR